jgi:lantibiotic biosynthesis protein
MRRPPTQAAPPPDHEPTPGWSHSLSTGAAGIALLHFEYAAADPGRRDAARAWASVMARRPVIARPDFCGLYEGAPAVAFSLHSARNPAYTVALGNLDQHIAAITRHRLDRAHQRIDRRHLPALREFDLISGLTGIGAYLLAREGDLSLLRDVLGYLVRLTEPLVVSGESLPGWWCAGGPRDEPEDRWPGGHGNLGLAHGVAGPLALLSTTMRRGVDVAGQAGAIRRLCVWLDGWRTGSGNSVWWPGVVSRARWRLGAFRPTGPQRPSWCYGTPGLARAQQLAALALGDRSRRRAAEEALLACVSDPRQLSLISDASLCHGWAGLVHTTWRAATDDGGSADLAEQVPRLRRRMAQHLERHGPPSSSGLLEGTTGLRLVERVPERSPPATRWDACLLVAG